ncbi:hypothetical protein [Endozoicomonas elysicola]|uniref:hypothetical protein n=1 Tax=Endozoicomonas elysicola TaxID=305900 RepID=UPI0013628243|nr:hypothetical protein [Endozoicomonas elysicola]
MKLISNCYSALTACQAEVVANSEKAAYLQGRFDGRVDVSCKNHIDEKRYLNVTLQQLQNTSSQLKADNKVLQSKLTTLRTELKNTANNEASLRTELENALEQIAQNEADQSLVATLSAELENTITQEQAAAGGSLLGFLSIFGTAGFFKREQICRMISSCCSWLCSGRQQDSTESVANQQAIEEGVPLQAVGTVDESGSRSYSEVTRPHRSTMSRA